MQKKIKTAAAALAAKQAKLEEQRGAAQAARDEVPQLEAQAEEHKEALAQAEAELEEFQLSIQDEVRSVHSAKHTVVHCDSDLCGKTWQSASTSQY
jgi:seryl-tRNA synthetase